MRQGLALTIGYLLVGFGSLSAQERIALPPPDSTPGQSSGAVPDGPPIPATPPGGSTGPATTPPPLGPSSQGPGPYPQGGYPGMGYPPYGPPPAIYGPPPYGPPPYGPPLPYRSLFSGDPARNPLFWFGVEGLVWWSKSQPLSPPVITTGPASEGANAGGLGSPGTVNLNGPLNFGAQGGLRLYAGGWLEPSHTFGIDGSVFFLGQQSSGFGAYDGSGSGNAVLNEPVNGAPFSTQVSYPGVQTGGVSVNTSTRFTGVDINGLFNVYRSSNWTLNALAGFRFYELDESVSIIGNSYLFQETIYTDNFGNVLADAPPGSSVTTIDQFNTRNSFYGGQLGAQFYYNVNRWSFGAITKLALGDTHEVVTVNGVTNVYPINGNPVSLGGGNYATIQSGRYSSDHFAFAPEVTLNVGYQFTPFLRGMMGYNFIYLSSVARPGDQIDNTFNGTSRPSVPMASSSFWAQGLTFSLQFSF